MNVGAAAFVLLEAPCFYGGLIPRSLQIFRASLSLSSTCLGTVEVLRFEGFQ